MSFLFLIISNFITFTLTDIMTDPNIKTIKHLGPYKIDEIDDDILGNVVWKQEIPVIIQQRVAGAVKYAVLAKDKRFKVACAGCFRNDMKITDKTRCKMCSSHGKHFDTKDGIRIATCKDDGDIGRITETKEVIIDTDASKEYTAEDQAKFRQSVLDTCSRNELLIACKKKGLRLVDSPRILVPPRAKRTRKRKAGLTETAVLHYAPTV